MLKLVHTIPNKCEPCTVANTRMKITITYIFTYFCAVDLIFNWIKIIIAQFSLDNFFLFLNISLLYACACHSTDCTTFIFKSSSLACSFYLHWKYHYNNPNGFQDGNNTLVYNTLSLTNMYSLNLCDYKANVHSTIYTCVWYYTLLLTCNSVVCSKYFP